jgi:signal transduction histidine kinase
MNRLWVRLSLYFSIFILCGVVMFAVLPRLLLSYNVSDIMVRTRDRVITQLQEIYAKDGNWTGASSLLHPYDSVLPRGFGTQPSALVFADAEGNIIYDGTGQREDQNMSVNERAKAFPITVNGSVRGYLMFQVLNFTPPLPSGDDLNFGLRGLVNGLIVFAIIAGCTGLAAGIIVSRQLTAPLSELAETVRTFRQPSIAKRASVKGTIEVREVATAFNQMVEFLVESEHLRRNLVGDVAHELRTPLTVLQANIQAILDDLYPLTKTEIQNLQVQTDLLQRLVNDLHELAQAEAHQLPLHMTSADMKDLIQNLVERFNAVAHAKGVTLCADTPVESVVALVDPDRIAQVLQNLIQNSLSHTPDGGKITVDVSQADHNLVIEVRDTGAGISLEDQKRIFERFYRTDEARSRATGGAGLGLPISKAIIEMHHGTIQVSSDGVKGHGTTFSIQLPVERGV